MNPPPISTNKESDTQINLNQQKPTVLIPWLLVVIVLFASLGLHLLTNPVSEVQQKINTVTNQISASFPESMDWIVNFCLTVYTNTQIAPISALFLTAAFGWIFIRPLISSLLGAVLAHILLLITGGTNKGWRITARAFAFNRIGVEVVSIVFAGLVCFLPWSIPTKILVLIFALPSVRLVGMGVLLSEMVREQGIGFFRSFFIIGPFFVVFTIASILFSLGTVVWLGLWLIVKSS